MNNEIKGISCEVKNCIFHDTGDCCTAGQIKVGNPQAMHESETKCETFECSDDCKCE